MDNLTNQFTNITGNMGGQLTNLTGNLSSQFQNGMAFVNGDSMVSKVVKVALICAILIATIELGKKIYFKLKKYSLANPWIVKETKDATKRVIIEQDPSKDSAVTLKRSENEFGGLEFTYSMWIFIDNWEYKYGQWKHIMHKGNPSSWPNRAPGIWLHPKKNAIRVYMNTFKNVGEFADIENIPLNKWFHLSVAVRQRNIDLFINGNIVKRHQLKGIPKQNYGNVYVNAWRGFSGYLSRAKYYDYYLSFAELDSLVKAGPSTKLPESTSKANAPPYLPYNWWANSK